MRPIPVRLPDNTVARLDFLAEQRSALAGIDVTRSDAARLAVSAGLDVLLDGRNLGASEVASTPHGGASVPQLVHCTSHAPAPTAVEAQLPAPAPEPLAEVESWADLARMFPCMRDVEGVDPLDLDALERALYVALEDHNGIPYVTFETYEWPPAAEMNAGLEPGDEPWDEVAGRLHLHRYVVIPFLASLVQTGDGMMRHEDTIRRLRGHADLRLLPLLDAEHRGIIAAWFAAPRALPLVAPPEKKKAKRDPSIPGPAMLRRRIDKALRSGFTLEQIAEKAGFISISHNSPHTDPAERARVAKALDALGAPTVQRGELSEGERRMREMFPEPPTAAALRKRIEKAGVSPAELARLSGVKEHRIGWIVNKHDSLFREERADIGKALTRLGH